MKKIFYFTGLMTAALIGSMHPDTPMNTIMAMFAFCGVCFVSALALEAIDNLSERGKRRV